MKIVYDHTTFLQKRGGVSRMFWELIKRFIYYPEVQVSLYEGIGANQYDFNSLKNNFKKYHKIKWFVDEKPYGFFMHNLNKLNRALVNSINNNYFFNNFINDNDLYHPTFFNPHIKNIKTIPIIITVYDMAYERFPQYYTDRKRLIKRDSIERADKIIAISENTKKELIEILKVNPEKISVIPLASSISINTPKNIFKNEKPYLLYVGYRKAYKNFSTFLRQYIKDLSDEFDLVCFGSTPFDKQEKVLIKKIQNSQNSRVRHITGNDSILKKYYANAFCFVYPSIYEGFGLPILEAMSCGCPVVVSNTSSIPEVAGEAAIYFNPCCMDEMVECVKRLKNSAIRENYINKGYKQAKKFSWDITAEKTYQIYKTFM